MLRRRREPELMDDPALEASEHRGALSGLARLNALTGTDRGVWGAIRGEAARVFPRALRVMDVATGAGDLLVRLAARAAREGVRLELHGCDVSGVALTAAREMAARAGVDVTLGVLDVLEEGIEGEFDVVHCGLFVHHLDPPEVEMLLGRMAEAGRVVVVQDLRRSVSGLVMARVVPRLVTGSRVVHVDAVRSVRGAYTVEELEEMAARAGMAGARVRRMWPQRMLMVWRREA